MDYLMEEVLERHTPEIKAFLLSTSILESFSGDLCDNVLQLKAGTSSKIIERLVKSNSFIITLDGRYGRSKAIELKALAARSIGSKADYYMNPLPDEITLEDVEAIIDNAEITKRPYPISKDTLINKAFAFPLCKIRG